MKKVSSVAISVALGLMHWGGVNSYAQGSSDEVVVNSEGNLRMNEDLRNHIQRLRNQRTVLVTLGGVSTVGGIALVAAGVSENQSAGDVPGCTRDGSTVYCDNQESTNEAQDRIDRSEAMMAGGLVLGVTGAGLLVWGILKGSKARRLERSAEQKSYSFDLVPSRDGARFVLNKSF